LSHILRLTQKEDTTPQNLAEIEILQLTAGVKNAQPR